MNISACMPHIRSNSETQAFKICPVAFILDAMPVEVFLKKIAKRGRVVDVTTLTVPHETNMTILDLKKKVITIMDADASHGAHDLHISHHGGFDAKSGTTVLPNDNPVADDEKGGCHLSGFDEPS